MLFEAELHKNRDTVLSFRLKGFAHEISACIKAVQKHHLVFIGYITCQQDFKHFSWDCAEYFSWADKYLRIPYDDGYYQIQLMNNQLINSQRALMKSNRQLKEVLQEVRQANNLIAILERDELTGLYTAASFYKKARERIDQQPDQEFEIYLQPKVTLPEGKLAGAEALIRWKHPEMGCDFAQGYYYSKPRSFAELLDAE